MKRNSTLKSILGVIAIGIILCFNIGFGNNLKSNNNIIALSQLVTITSASAEDVPPGTYLCYDGWEHPGGIYFMDCADCTLKLIMPDREGVDCTVY